MYDVPVETERQAGSEDSFQIPIQGCANESSLLQSHTLGIAERRYQGIYRRPEERQLRSQRQLHKGADCNVPL